MATLGTDELGSGTAATAARGVGPVVEQVEWTDPGRYAWELSYQARRSSAGEYVKRSLAGEMTAMGLFDVTPAMARPVVATSPYTSLKELTEDLGIRREARRRPLPASTVSAVVGRELLLPQDSSRTELELLREVVHVVTKGVRLSKRCLISGCFGHAARLRRSMVSSS